MSTHMFARKKPCGNCPFRVGVGSTFQLNSSRLSEIERASAFQCHKSLVSGVPDDAPERRGDNPVQCAGLMAVLHRENKPNQIMQVAQRFGEFDPETLDPEQTAYQTWADVMSAHLHGEEP